MRKSKSPHSSVALFWMGVPLSTRRCCALRGGGGGAWGRARARRPGRRLGAGVR